MMHKKTLMIIESVIFPGKCDIAFTVQYIHITILGYKGYIEIHTLISYKMNVNLYMVHALVLYDSIINLH